MTLRTGSGETTQNLIALPDQQTYFEITPDKPSDSLATLEVVSNGSACEAEDFAGKRFVQVGNLQTY
jgi:hypothetical protein